MNTEITVLVSWPKILMTSFPCLGRIFVILHCKSRQLICLIFWVFRIDKPKALSLLLHTADISHPAKAWDLHHRWTMSLLEEFFRQVKLRKSLYFCSTEGMCRTGQGSRKTWAQIFSFFSGLCKNLLNDTRLSYLALVALAIMPLGKFVSHTLSIDKDVST